MYPIGPCVCPAYRAHLEHRLADGVLVVVDEVALAVGHHRSRAPLFVARPPHGARPAADPPSRLCRPLDQGPRAPPLSHVSHSDIASDVICHPDHSMHPDHSIILNLVCWNGIGVLEYCINFCKFSPCMVRARHARGFDSLPSLSDIGTLSFRHMAFGEYCRFDTSAFFLS